MAEQDHFSLEDYWMQDITQSLDVGIVVLDLDFKIVLWNSFMENHHGTGSEHVLGREIFEMFDDLPGPCFYNMETKALFISHESLPAFHQCRGVHVSKHHHYSP